MKVEEGKTSCCGVLKRPIGCALATLWVGRFAEGWPVKGTGMARKNNDTKKKPVEQYEHKGKKRTNNPPVVVVNQASP